MFQIIFNELSAAEMSALPKELQLDLIAEFEVMPSDLDESVSGEHFGSIERDGKKLLRYRAKDYRIYFENTGEGRGPSRGISTGIGRRVPRVPAGLVEPEG